ncbi:MAG: hypothetical protein PVG65_00235 [Candidatus Thorarchaeota archaeon]|jgi:hypothetical protein
MNKEKSQNNPSRKKIDRILFVGVLLVLLSGPLGSYIKGHNMEILVDILNLVRFFYLIAFFVYLVDRAFNKQDVRQISEKDTEIIENIIHTCLKDTPDGEPLGTHELVYCVQHYLEKRGYSILPKLTPLFMTTNSVLCRFLPVLWSKKLFLLCFLKLFYR